MKTEVGVTVHQAFSALLLKIVNATGVDIGSDVLKQRHGSFFC